MQGLRETGVAAALGMACIVAGALLLSWPQQARWDGAWPALAVLGACLAWAVDNNVHDEPVAPGTRHSHPHRHEALRHSHPHYPDAHHRHPH